MKSALPTLLLSVVTGSCFAEFPIRFNTLTVTFLDALELSLFQLIYFLGVDDETNRWLGIIRIWLSLYVFFIKMNKKGVVNH